MSEDELAVFDRNFCQRITGIRTFFEIMIKKLGINFCMRCFTEVDAVTEIDVVDVLGRARKATLCEPCLVEWKKLDDRNKVLP